MVTCRLGITRSGDIEPRRAAITSRVAMKRAGAVMTEPKKPTALFPVLVVTAVTAIVLAMPHPRAAQAQAAPKVKALFEKYDLIGTFAADCSSPVDGRNV